VVVHLIARCFVETIDYYSKLAKRHGHHIAITDVANKMVTIIWYMLVNKKPYNERIEDPKDITSWSEQQNVCSDNSHEAFT